MDVSVIDGLTSGNPAVDAHVDAVHPHTSSIRFKTDLPDKRKNLGPLVRRKILDTREVPARDNEDMSPSEPGIVRKRNSRRAFVIYPSPQRHDHRADTWPPDRAPSSVPPEDFIQ